MNDIGRVLNDAGAFGLNGKPWSAKTVSLFLRSPRNAGLRSHTRLDKYGKVIGD
ncbi:recombinase family protein [Mycobacterium botniense]|uniref:recombinase family protein n=1 Tax=Mycobacterium botniense TaxID=84962 RepID=UPI001FEB6BD9|nr:recombinase family protein [Mycobacterium botniense]